MLEVLQISENGLKANQQWINSISHNVANMQTPGFKKSNINFGELVGNGAANRADLTQFNGMGVAISGQTIDFRQGDLKMTNRPLDLAIDGSGFFEIELEDGNFGYTRLGSFTVDIDGRLVTKRGQVFSSEIIVPLDSKSVRVESNGTIFADLGLNERIEIGQIQLVNFANPEGLRAIGNETYVATESSGEPELAIDNETRKILQGFLEMSNVDLIDEMGDLLLAQRSYQLNARLIQTADQILETINNLRR